jgi:triosephosphate isomerase
MADRKPFVGGNWKMNLHMDEATALAQALTAFGHTDRVDVAICPALPYLPAVGDKLKAAGSGIMLGAQNFYHEANGAFTGEVSLSMLKDVGVDVVLVGHSERRHVIGETDAVVNEKVIAALEAGMHVILCIGEKIEQREADKTHLVNYGQVCLGLAGVSEQQMARVTIAYEPVWAIGTGKTASPDNAQNAHAAVRHCLRSIYNDLVADSVRIQYGGSMKPANAGDLLARPDVDGGLIGGASLKADDFMGILNAAL